MVVSNQCDSGSVETSSDNESVLDTADNNTTTNDDKIVEMKDNSDQGGELNAGTLKSSTERIDADIDVDNNDPEDGLVAMDTVKHAPDGGWGWCIVLGALLLRTVIGK